MRREKVVLAFDRDELLILWLGLKSLEIVLRPNAGVNAYRRTLRETARLRSYIEGSMSVWWIPMEF